MRAAAIFNGLAPQTFDALDTETVQEMELLYRDGLIGGRGALFFNTHLLTLVHALGGAFSKHHRTMRPTEFFPHLEAYFKPALNVQERNWLAWTTLPGFKSQFIEHLRGKRG